MLLLSGSISILAQNVKVKKDEILVDGQKIGQVQQEKAIPGYKSILVQSNEGETQVSFLPEKVTVNDSLQTKYKVLFESLSQSTYVNASIGAKKYYINKLVKTGALTAEGLDEKGVEAFIRKHGFQMPTDLRPQAQGPSRTGLPRPPYTIVQRSRQGAIMVVNGKIKQGAKDIAQYEKSDFTEKAKPMLRLVIKDMDGSLILTATFPKFNSDTATYQVSGTEGSQTVAIKANGTDSMRIKSFVEAVVEQGVF